MIKIRKAAETDKEAVWQIIKQVIAGGDTYVFAPDSPREKMLEYWFGADKQTYVAEYTESPPPNDKAKNDEAANDETKTGDLFIPHSSSLIPQIGGSFYLKPNQPDLGAHVCNAGYMVSAAAKGKGIGRQMAEFSLVEAKRLGFHAMQFNFVVKSNETAVRLWLSLGFEVIGEIPEAFRHKKNGLTNALIMYRKL